MEEVDEAKQMIEMKQIDDENKTQTKEIYATSHEERRRRRSKNGPTLQSHRERKKQKAKAIGQMASNRSALKDEGIDSKLQNQAERSNFDK